MREPRTIGAVIHQFLPLAETTMRRWLPRQEMHTFVDLVRKVPATLGLKNDNGVGRQLDAPVEYHGLAGLWTDRELSKDERRAVHAP